MSIILGKEMFFKRVQRCLFVCFGRRERGKPLHVNGMTTTLLKLVADYTTRLQTLTTTTTTRRRKTHSNSNEHRGPAVGALSMTPWRPPTAMCKTLLDPLETRRMTLTFLPAGPVLLGVLRPLVMGGEHQRTPEMRGCETALQCIRTER